MSSEENAVPSSPVNTPHVNTQPPVNTPHVTSPHGTILACAVCFNPKVMDENFYENKCCNTCFKFFNHFLESPIQYFCYSTGVCTIDGSKDYASGKLCKYRCKSCWLKTCLKLFYISDDMTRKIKDFLPRLEIAPLPQEPSPPQKPTSPRIPTDAIEEWSKNYFDSFNRQANMNDVPENIMIQELESPASPPAGPTETTCHICGKPANTSKSRIGGICCQSCLDFLDDVNDNKNFNHENPASPRPGSTKTTCHVCGKRTDSPQLRFDGVCCRSCTAVFDDEPELKNSYQVSVENAGCSLETPFLNLEDKTIGEKKRTKSHKIPRALTFEEPNPPKSGITKRMVKRAVSRAMNDPVLQQNLEDPRKKSRRISQEKLTESEFPLPSFTKEFARLSSEHRFPPNVTTAPVRSQEPHTQEGTAKSVPIGTINPQQTCLQLQQYRFPPTVTTAPVRSQEPHTQEGTTKSVPIGTINPQQTCLQLQQSQLDLKENEIECQLKIWEVQFKFWKNQNICLPDKKHYVKYIKLVQKWKTEIRKMRIKRLKAKSEHNVASNQNFPSTNSTPVVNPNSAEYIQLPQYLFSAGKAVLPSIAIMPTTSADTSDESSDPEAISEITTSSAMDQLSDIDAFSFDVTPSDVDQAPDTNVSSATPVAMDQSTEFDAFSTTLAMDLFSEIRGTSATTLAMDQPSDINISSVVNPYAADCYQLPQNFLPGGMPAAPSITVTPVEAPDDDAVCIRTSDTTALLAMDKPLTIDIEEFSVENSNRSQGS